MEPVQILQHIEPATQPEPVPVVEPVTLEGRVNTLEYALFEQGERMAQLESMIADVIARNCLLMKPLQASTVEAGESHSAGDKA